MAGLRCLSDPAVVALDTGEFIVKEDLEYQYNGGIKGISFSVIVPSGFITDFASVPWYGKLFIDRTGPWNKAAALHDWLYTSRGLSRTISDALFLEAMTIHGVSKIRRHVMYLAVHLGGGKTYRKAYDNYAKDYPGFLAKFKKD